jgi:hypothetical protein
VKEAVRILFSFIGRYAYYALPAGVLIGLVLPFLAEKMFFLPSLLKPFVLRRTSK